MKIAIVGAGISGLTAAYYLHKKHQIKVFESADKIGGHTATIDVEMNRKHYAIDTGFIVFNDWTYPNFIELMNELDVGSKPTEMSFSVRCDESGIEYGGNNLNTMFAQRRNLFKPSFHLMLRDILRFNRESVAHLQAGLIDEATCLGEYLAANGYGEAFKFQYLLPMGSAIWSASTESMLDFPLLFFVKFFKNHGLLSVSNRPQWRVIEGGSGSYLEPLTRGFATSIETGSSITKINRGAQSVELIMANGKRETFDQLVLACHSDQALALLGDATSGEKAALTAIPYKQNEVVLHCDQSLLPRNKLAWSSWNYWLKQRYQESAVLTYNMNILQGLDADSVFSVTMNASDAIAKNKIIESFSYSHPQFSQGSVQAAQKIQSINGAQLTWYAGAYLGNGFHEDGVSSGRAVAEMINHMAPPLQSADPNVDLRVASSA